ncbi:MAG TPA: M48 family metallopeptidase [Pyrinomonadaceae bacterium]|nr:M48 family metallopeptidase [Pyrinomonadaceae bacterium]
MNVRGCSSWLLVALLVTQAACGGLLAGGGFDRLASHESLHAGTGFNLFSPEQDVELGKLSAEEVTRQLPLLRDERTTRYVQRLGERLAAKAPGYRFTYKFFVISSPEVNAFSLPGGYVFVNSGAVAAARDEGELAGVLAHEIAHVALRHGTNQASKAYVAKTGRDVLDAVTGGRRNEVGAFADAFAGNCANVIFMKLNRSAELQADAEGARMMAAAGYDPHDMANFFARLGEQSNEHAPEFLSDHPDPLSRVAALEEIIPMLGRAPQPSRDTAEFRAVRSRLMGRA